MLQQPERDNVSSLPPPPTAGDTPTPGGGGGRAKAPKKRGGKPVDFGLVNRLMDSFALIYGTDTVWDGEKMRIVKVSALRLAFGGDAVKIWLAHPERRMVNPEDLVFEPGHEVPEPQINMFAGFEVTAVACNGADVAPMLELLRHLCSATGETADDVDAVVHWVMRWMALPLQKPGTKMQTALVFHGPQGTGKNLFFDVWRDLFGRYGVTVGQTELEDKFNDWLSCKLAIVGDEVVSRQEMYHHKNKLKLVVTQEQKFPIRAIQQSVRWESNHANVVFLSNESQPLALEERDRRYMVVYTPVAADEALYTRVAAFLAGGGAAKWMHYLLNYTLEDFTRHAKPLMTRAKAELIELGWKPAERFTHEWLEGFLSLPVRVCSTEQLYRAFRRWCDQQGEKWPPAQALFSKSVERWAGERGKRQDEPALRCKAIKLQHTSGERKVMRCWLPKGTGAPEGYTEGAWAAESVDHFEASLRAFTRPLGAQGDGE
jgi:hypothetical protein